MAATSHKLLIGLCAYVIKEIMIFVQFDYEVKRREPLPIVSLVFLIIRKTHLNQPEMYSLL